MVKDDTTEKMWERYQAGDSLRTVGTRYGITGEAVRLRFKKAGYTSRSKSEAQVLWQRQAEPANLAELLNQALQLWNTTLDNVQIIAQKVDLPPTRVDTYIRANTTEEQRLDRTRTILNEVNQDTYTNEEMLNAIRACAEFLDRTPGRKVYEEFAITRNLPSEQAIANRFVSWNDAITEAGFTPHNQPKGLGLPKYSNDDFEFALLRVAEIVGRKPSMGDYCRYRQSSEPNVHTFRQRYGGWRNALQILL
jgi:hypothetical protein